MTDLVGVIGYCCYCTDRDGRTTPGSVLRDDQPYVIHPSGTFAHVACEIDARRRGIAH